MLLHCFVLKKLLGIDSWATSLSPSSGSWSSSGSRPGPRHGSLVDQARDGRLLQSWSSTTRFPLLTILAADASSPRGMKKLIDVMASAKPVSSAVLLLQEVVPKNAGCSGSQTTGPQRIWTKLSCDTAVIPEPAASVPSRLRLKLPVDSLQPGNSIPVNLVVTRQVGNTEILFLGFGSRKPSGLSGSGLHKSSRHTSRTRVRGDTEGVQQQTDGVTKLPMVGVVQRRREDANSVTWHSGTTAPGDPIPPHWTDATPHW